MISDLAAWSAQIVGIYQGAENHEGSDLIAEVAQSCIHDIRRRHIERREPTPVDWEECTKAHLLATWLLNRIETDEPEQIAGWRYGEQPQNIVQDIAFVLTDLATMLSESAREIEAEYPDLAEYFDTERAEYRRQFKAPPTLIH